MCADVTPEYATLLPGYLLMNASKRPWILAFHDLHTQKIPQAS